MFNNYATCFVIILCFYSYQTVLLLQIGENCQSIVTGNKKLSEYENVSMELSSCDPGIPLECINGRCQCKRGYTINRNGTECLEIGRNGLESRCQESIQCWKGLLGRLSECNVSTSRCQCYESETLSIVFHQGRCYYGESLGDYCQIEGLCVATTMNAICKTGVCQCKDGYVNSWDKSRCLEFATNGLNSTCEENIQCEKSQLGTLSECNQETMRCQCYQIPMVSTVFDSGRCYFGASLGDVCHVTAQCQSSTKNSECGTDKKCRCDELGGFVPNALGSTCLSILSSDDGFEFECEVDIQCTRTLGHFSRCNVEKHKCECFFPEAIHQPTQNDNQDTSKMIIVSAQCYSTKRTGEFCKFNQQCSALTENSVCTNETCKCEAKSHVASLDNKRCLEIGMDGLGSRCEEDQQCTHSALGPLSRCDLLSKNCTCSNILPAVYYNKACFFHRQLGTPCESNSECKAAGNFLAGCIDGRCQCDNGTTMDGQFCLPVKSELTSGAQRLTGVFIFRMYIKYFTTFIY